MFRPGLSLIHTVAFYVGFIIYIDAIFITQFIELAVLRIVAEAHAVDVVLFHQGEVLAHQLFGNIMSCFGIMFVYVYTFQLDGLAVDEKQTYGLPFSAI